MSVVMVDLDDGTLHLPRSIAAKQIAEWGALITACGLTLDNVNVGPPVMVSERASRRCPDCFPSGGAQ